MTISKSQRLLESWWNEQPEFRWVEILCGENYRVRVRLYEVDCDPNSRTGERIVAEAECGSLEQAIAEAVLKGARVE